MATAAAPAERPTWAQIASGSPRSWLAPALIVLAVAVTFGPVARFPFLEWDDPVNITRNPFLNPPSPANILAFWAAPYAGLYIPVTYSFWSLEAALSSITSLKSHSLNPAVFHAGNLVLHLLCVFSVFVLLGLFTKRRFAALVGSLLFALHPLVVESVCWVTETKGLLCALFSFVALALYLARNRQSSPRRRRSLYAISIGCFVVALLSKPNAVVVPLMAFLLETYCMKRPWRQSALVLAPWFLIAAGPILLTKSLQPDETLVDVPLAWQRPLVAADAIGFYVEKLFCPIRLGPDYGRSPRNVLASQGPYVAAAGLALIVSVLAACRQWRPLFAFSLFAVGFLPILGLVPFAYQQFSTVADRYAYLPMFAPALALAWFVDRFGTRRWLGYALASLVATGAVLSHAQANHWRSNKALFQQAIRINPRSLLAHNGLGNLLAGQGDWTAAVREFRVAVASEPNSSSAHYNLGRALARSGNRDQAVAELRQSLALRPDYEKAHYELARVFADAGQLSQARDELLLLTRINPRRFDAWYDLGRLAAVLGDRHQAIRYFDQALALSPRSADAHEQLAELLQQEHQIPEAIEHLRKVVQLDPTRGRARKQLSRLEPQPSK